MFGALLWNVVMPALGAVTGWTAGRGRPASLTLGRMRSVVNLDVEKPEVFEAATAIVAGVDGRDYAGQAAALMAWLRACTRFVRDPTDDELLRSPTYMLALVRRDGTAAGDCDDLAMLAAALAKAIGFKVRFVAEAYRGGPTAPLVHVYTIVSTLDGWRALDTQKPPNALPLPPVRRILTEV